MASVKVKFRASTIEGKAGVIYYQIIHERVIRQISTDYKLYPTEWSAFFCRVDKAIMLGERSNVLKIIVERVERDTARLTNIISTYERARTHFTADDIVRSFEEILRGETLFIFTQNVINRLRELRKVRCVETYTTTLHSLMRFREGEDILLVDITSDFIISYEAHLKYEGLSMNTISFYMRILRAIYNRAVDQELIEQRYPFKKVYTGVGKTMKRALPLKYIKQIKEIDLSLHPKVSLARDLFLLSFYTRGMSFVDMAYLRKADLKNGVLTYVRRKTGQQLHIKWERCMQEIVERNNSNNREYLLPIITQAGSDERAQYKNRMAKTNLQLKLLSEMLSLPMPLTMYVARHSWASVAKSRNVPISIISEGMGHNSEMTTQIYLASLDTTVVDRANHMILGLLG